MPWPFIGKKNYVKKAFGPSFTKTVKGITKYYKSTLIWRRAPFQATKPDERVGGGKSAAFLYYYNATKTCASVKFCHGTQQKHVLSDGKNFLSLFWHFGTFSRGTTGPCRIMVSGNAVYAHTDLTILLVFYGFFYI